METNEQTEFRLFLQMYTRHNQPETVCVAIAPDGSEFPVMDQGDGFFWCAGRIANSAEKLIDLLYEHWNDETPFDNKYERQERSFTEFYDE